MCIPILSQHCDLGEFKKYFKVCYPQALWIKVLSPQRPSGANEKLPPGLGPGSFLKSCSRELSFCGGYSIAALTTSTSTWWQQGREGGAMTSAADDPSVSQSVFIITEKVPTRAFSWLKDTMLNGHLNMVSRCEIGRWRKYQN